MALIQVSCSFIIDLIKLYDVDFFKQGIYQIRTFIRCCSESYHSKGIPICYVNSPELIKSFKPSRKKEFSNGGAYCKSAAIINVKKSLNNSDISNTKSLFDEVTVAVSKSILFEYQSQSDWLMDSFRQNVTWQSPVDKIIDTINDNPVELVVQLYFLSSRSCNISEVVDLSDLEFYSSMTLASERILKINFQVDRGFNYFFSVFFNWKFLCAVELQIHGLLLDISPSHFALNYPIDNSSIRSQSNFSKQIMKTSSSEKPSSLSINFFNHHFVYKTWFSILFNNQQNYPVSSELKIQALEIFKCLTKFLLSANEAFCNIFCDLLTKLPASQRIEIERKNYYQKFHQLTSEVIDALEDENQVADLFSVHISKLASENTILFDDFSRTFIGQRNEMAFELLRFRAHCKRMRRLSESFFTREIPIHLLLSTEESHSCLENVFSTIRSSPYFQNLESLTIFCCDTDGHAIDQPIIFEDRYSNSDGVFSIQDNSKFVEGCLSEISPSRMKYFSYSHFPITFTNVLEEQKENSNSSYNNSVVLRSKNFDSNSNNSRINDNKLNDRFSQSVSFVKPISKKFDSSNFLNKLSKKKPNEDAFVSQQRRSTIPDLQNSLAPTNIFEDNILEMRRNNSLVNPKQVNKDRASEKRKSISFPIVISTSSLHKSNESNEYALSLTKNGTRELDSVLPTPQLVHSISLVQNQSFSDSIVAIPEIAQKHAKSLLDKEDDSFEIITLQDLIPSDSNYKSSKVPLTQEENSFSSSDYSTTVIRRRANYAHKNGPSTISSSKFLIPFVTDAQLRQMNYKENLQHILRSNHNYYGKLYSDLGAGQAFFTIRPYFSTAKSLDAKIDESTKQPVHLIVCVHGLEGCASDLRIVRIYLQLSQGFYTDAGCLGQRLEFLMSSSNSCEATFLNLDTLANNLTREIEDYLKYHDIDPWRISFIGHSLGTVIIRAALAGPHLSRYFDRLHTFLSLNGPHLGTCYNSSSLINLGLWLIRRYKKNAGSIQQLCLSDAPDDNLRHTYLYKLSSKPGLDLFKYVLLVSSRQDYFVPYHSSRVELCREAVRDNSQLGKIYSEMVKNIVTRVIHTTKKTTLLRYDVNYSFTSTNKASSKDRLIGKAAHISVIDNEIFLEKFFCVCAGKYFAVTS